MGYLSEYLSSLEHPEQLRAATVRFLLPIHIKQVLMLKQLESHVESKRKQNKKLHNVWELSFDWKGCRSNKFAWQKIDYMHNDPCTGEWQLANNPTEYIHSSAKFYLTGEQGIYPVTDFMEMEEIDFNKGK